jgi:hypothetical protein
MPLSCGTFWLPGMTCEMDGASSESKIWCELPLYKQLMRFLFIPYDFLYLMIQGIKAREAGQAK